MIPILNEVKYYLYFLTKKFFQIHQELFITIYIYKKKIKAIALVTSR